MFFSEHKPTSSHSRSSYFTGELKREFLLAKPVVVNSPLGFGHILPSSYETSLRAFMKCGIVTMAVYFTDVHWRCATLVLGWVTVSVHYSCL